jgi:glycosyltransferase involved in cell wall biosynthesis
VAVVVPGFPAMDDETFIPAVSGMLQAVAASGIRLHVFTLCYPKRSGEYTWRGIPVSAFGGWPRGTWLPATWGALVRHHRERPFDLIHAFWATDPGLVSALASLRLGIPLVVSALGGEFVRMPHCDYGAQRESRWRRLVPCVLRRARVLITGSSRQGELAGALCPEVSARWVQLPSGVPLEEFLPAAGGGPARVAGEPLRILSIANLLPVKNPRLLVEALRCLPPGVTLDLLGDGPQRALIAAAAQEVGGERRVRLHGWVPHTGIMEHYRRADVFALASWHEDQCAAVQEALAAGLPVVSTAVGISRDAITDGHNGSCVPPGDARAFAAALEPYLADADLRHGAGRSSRAYAEAHLDRNRLAQRLVEVYRGPSGVRR